MYIKLQIESYIAHPYWPETEKIVSIQKQSGYNRARSEDKRELALLRYLEKTGMSLDDYKGLEQKAAKAWYTNSEGYIIVPAHQIAGCLVAATYSAPAGCKIASAQLRSLLKISDFSTKKKTCDRVFERFILPKDGKGNPLSNQRRLTCTEVIENCEATGQIEFDERDVKSKTVLDLIRYAGKYIGVGASRKMGYGRFKLDN